jgi:PAS domain S-box-containing protein
MNPIGKHLESGRKKKVLAVDNHPVVLNFMRNLLVKKGHRVMTAEDGLTALDILETFVPDVVFVDLIMPNISGEKLCRIIRGKPETKDVHIVILSAIAVEHDIDLAELGANACIAKGPVNQMAKHILAALDALEKRPPTSPTESVVGLKGLSSRQITGELLSVRSHFEAILGSMSEGILEVNPDGRIVYANPAALSLIGENEETLLGSHLEAYFVEDHREGIKDLVRRLSADSQDVEEDLYVLVGDKYVSIKALPIMGKRSNVIVILNDVTDLKRSERAVKDEQERLLAIFDGNPIPTFVIDRDHKVILWNSACEILTGVPRGQALGRPVDSSVFDPCRRRPVLADLVLGMEESSMRALYGDRNVNRCAFIPEAFEVSDRVTVGGVQRHMHFLAARLRDTRGKIVGAIETLQDITDRKRLEEQLFQSQKMEAIGRLASGVAHDFSNFLTSITGYADLMLMESQGVGLLHEYAKQIKKAGTRAGSLTRQLLAFGRRQVLKPEAVNLNEVITEMEKMLARLIGEDIELVTFLEPELALVEADPGQIEQVIMNLAINARDAMPKGGRLTIETANVDIEDVSTDRRDVVPAGTYVTLAVSDTGIGMDDYVQSKIFEPFFTTKETGQGTGLGLSTTYGIVKQSDGYINVHSHPRRGTTFRIYLPVSQRDAESVREEGISTEVLGGFETVLLVEDDDSVRNMAQAMLQGYGYKVLAAREGREALLISRQHAGCVHLLLTDVVMPGMSGRELAVRLRPSFPHLRVLYTSGYTENLLVSQGSLDPGSSFLQKPFSAEVLVRTVRKVLEAS